MTDICNVEHMRAWIAALRSDEFKQTRGALRLTDENGEHHYCCLGVAVELARRDGVLVIDEEELRGHLSRLGVTDPEKVDGVRWSLFGGLSPNAVEWLGIDNPNPLLASPRPEDLHRVPAIEANDDHRWTFAEIADALEETYLPDDWAVTVLTRAGIHK